MARKKTTTETQSVVEQARAFVKLCIDADSHNRVAAQDDLRFSAGDQWPAHIKQQRTIDMRPCLTIDKTDTFVRSVVNNMRQQRPRIKVHPVSDGANQAVADVIQGLVRHIEVDSNADVAYDTAADYQVRMGWGYWRILSKYVDETSWEQELRIERIRNPFSVYFDPSSTSPDGSDAKRCVITGKIPLADFEKKYPGKKQSSWSLTGPGDDVARKDEIMLAEFLRLEEEPEELCRLSDGSSKWRSELPSEEEMRDKGMLVIDRRQSMRIKLKWSLLSGEEELDKRDVPGKYLDVIPVYGAELIDNGKVIRYGMVRKLKDPQMQYNFWRTSQTEIVALAPKAPWLMGEGQDEGYEDTWDTANTKNFSRLKYKPVTVATAQGDVLLPPPQRTPPAAIPEASVAAAMAASEDLKAVAGMFDPSLGAPGQETSGTMVQKRQQQSDLSNFHFYDNLTRSVRHTGVVLLDKAPYYYDTQRVIRILGEDGTPDSVTINERAAERVLNDVTVGRYGVVMDTGPGYDTKRLEARDAMLALVTAFPKVAEVGSDLIVRQFDAPGMEALADRLEASNPIAQVEKQLPKDLDPKARQVIGGLMAQLEQFKKVAQQLQMEKDAKLFGIKEKEEAVTVREMHKEDAETDRLRMKLAAEDTQQRRDIAADVAMNTQDNRTSMAETVLTLETNKEIGRMKAQQHGMPNNNRPTNQQ